MTSADLLRRPARARRALAAERYTLSILSCAIVLSAPSVWAQPQPAQDSQDNIQFNPGFLEINGSQPADLSLFSQGNRVVPGVYRVDVRVNQIQQDSQQIRFEGAADVDAQPCLTRSQLAAWGVNEKAFPAIAVASENACVNLEEIIPDSKIVYDAASQVLSISIPQAAMINVARGSVSRDRWDDGINAGMLNYQLNYANNTGGNGSNAQSGNSYFGSLRGGVNLGPWQLRHFSTYNRDMTGASRWRAIETNLQRDVRSVRGRVLLGDGTTPSNLFDGIQFRGVQISSDDQMLPDSLQGYAPVIRGIAQSNAKVTVRQNGYIIYTKYVAPGPFAIDDLYPTASSGDLEVVVTEANGRETRFVQPFSAVPTLLREGVWRYSATSGKYRSGYNRATQPFFSQVTVARGLPAGFSAYGGAIGANVYQSGLAGIGKNLGDFGALSFDATHARSRAEDNVWRSGQSYRMLYAKSFAPTGTDFRILGYRYSTPGFRTFSETAEPGGFSADGSRYEIRRYGRRSRIEGQISQQLGTLGYAYVTARNETYWQGGPAEKTLQLGYNTTWRRVAIGAYFNYAKTAAAPASRQIMLTLQIPIGSSKATAQYSLTSSDGGRVDNQATLFGTGFDDNRLGYSVTAGQTNQGIGANGSASATYQGQMAQVDVGRSQGRGYGQTTVGLQGGMLVHGGGVTMSQSLGETVALVDAPGAKGVGVDGYTAVRTDVAGRTVVPYVQPYRVNRLALQTEDLGTNVDVSNAAVEVIPTRGAVVLANYNTTIGYRVMLHIHDARGHFPPFGSLIDDDAGKEVGVVGQDGQAFIAGAAEQGVIHVRWGDGAGMRCEASFTLKKPIDESAQFQRADAVCASLID